MIKKISIKTKMGWISAFENKGKIFKVKFGKAKKQSQSKVLKNFKKNLLTFFKKKTLNIKSPYKIQGNLIQKKIWIELKKIKPGQTKCYKKSMNFENTSQAELQALEEKLSLKYQEYKDANLKLDLTRGELAINGGMPVRRQIWKDNFSTGQEEKQAACRVLDSGYLSMFEGSHHPDAPFSFYGGPEVQHPGCVDVGLDPVVHFLVERPRIGQDLIGLGSRRKAQRT